MATFSKRIEIQQLVTATDSIGNQPKEWKTVVKPWCSAVITTGKEYYEAAQINAENDITFKMLYSRKIHEMKPSEIRIIYNGKAYDIKRITDYREQRRTLEIKAVEINGRD